MGLGDLIRGGIGGECKMPSIVTQTTFEGRLREEKERLEKRLENINEVLESLKNAPEVANVLEALNKLGY